MYDSLLTEYWKMKYSPDHELSEIRPYYKDYIDYIIKTNPLKKTAKIQDSVKGMALLNEVVTRYFCQNPKTRWATMSSIFNAPWDFIRSASYTWNKKKEDWARYERSKGEHQQYLFMDYCKKIHQMHLPRTQKLLVEDICFFESYLNAPRWLDHAICLARDLTWITGDYIRHLGGISDEAFSHDPEQLEKINELLCRTYADSSPSCEASPEMISDFLSFYLPHKK